MVARFDPDRDGKEWYDRERASTPERDWNQEMEINFDAGGGGLIYPRFDVRRHVLLRPIPLQKYWRYGFAIDPGVEVTAMLVGAITPDRIMLLIDEYYTGSLFGSDEEKAAVQHASDMKARLQSITDRVHGKDPVSGESNMAWEELFDTQLIDPSAGRREGSGLVDLSSVKMRYLEAGFDLRNANNDFDGGVEKVKELELLSLSNPHPNGVITDPSSPPRGWPRKFAFPHLLNYCAEKRRYRYDPRRPNKPADKQKDHLCDSERYLVIGLLEAPVIKEDKKPLTKSERRAAKATSRIRSLKIPMNERGNIWSRLKRS